MRLSRRKVELILLLAGALLAIVLLASSLSSLPLDPGQVRGGARPRSPGSLGILSPELRISPEIWRALRIAVIIMTPIALVYVLLSPELRRQAIRRALTMAAVGLLIYLWFRSRSLNPPEGRLEMPEVGPPGFGEMAAGASPGDFVLNPPPWLAFGLTAALVLLALVLAWMVWRALRRPDEIELLARQAQHAADEIEAGADFKDVILRCYYDMTQVLRAERGIERHRAMTPREFQQRLLAAGLPEEHVGRLTGLFESVRYGAHPPGQAEERAAVEALTAIARAARRPA